VARKQHGAITRGQLLRLGFTNHAIDHRIAKGRLFPIWRGVYAVGRAELSRDGVLFAAALSCGRAAALSHSSSAELWAVRDVDPGPIEVSVPNGTARRRRGIVVHRRLAVVAAQTTRVRGIPVMTPTWTLIDLAPRLGRAEIEAMINEANKRDLIDPEDLRRALDHLPRVPGVSVLRELLDRLTISLTDSELERRFLPIAAKAGLPSPQTGRRVSGFKVDFYWPGLGLVVETDGLRYHRTPAQQARDRLRDQAHAVAGLTALRFTHAQVRYEPDYVRATLAAVARRVAGTLPHPLR
jgi:predicted transcriptional regulator of viral defense system